MRGAAAAFILIALELLVGTFVLMFATRAVWRVVDRGHYRAATWVLFPLMLGLALTIPGRLRSHGLIAGALMAAFLAAVYSRRPLLEAVSGAAASAWGVWLLAESGLGACEPACAAGAVHALAGAFFLGAVTHGMTLGHWYLNQPRLPIDPLEGAARLGIASVAASLAVGVATRPMLLEGQVPGGILPVSPAGYWWSWLLLLAGTGVLALMARSTVRSRSTQSATGLLYIAMVVALGAQFVLTLLVVS